MKKTLSAVESFTGGLFASTIVSTPGASKYFKGSLVSYSSEVKSKLGVDISKGVINKEVASEMSIKGKEYFDTDVCVSFTGNAGPKPVEGRPEGLVYISINGDVFELEFEGTRNQIRQAAVDFALLELKKYI